PEGDLVIGTADQPGPLASFSSAVSPSRWKPPPDRDVVTDLLSGRADRYVDFDLRAAYPPSSASAWLVDRITGRLAEVAPDRHEVVLMPVRGRRHTLGLIAAAPKFAPGTD